jgi:hypothetical protein
MPRKRSQLPKRPTRPYHKKPGPLEHLLDSFTASGASSCTFTFSTNPGNTGTESSDTNHATSSEALRSVFSVRSTSPLETCPTVGCQTSLLPSQTLTDSLGTAHRSSEASLEFKLAELARQSQRVQLPNTRRDMVWRRMNELQVVMHLQGYTNLEFREGIVFTSDNEWDKGLPAFNGKALPYYARMQLNAARLLFILVLQRMGKTDEAPVQDFIKTMRLKPIVDLAEPVLGAEGIESDWDTVNTPFQNCWARLKRCLQALRICFKGQQDEASSLKTMRRRPAPSHDTLRIAEIAEKLTSFTSPPDSSNEAHDSNHRCDAVVSSRNHSSGAEPYAAS